MKYLAAPFIFISLFCISGCDSFNCQEDCSRLGHEISSYAESWPDRQHNCYCLTSPNHMQEVESIYAERLIELPAEEPK